MKRHWIYLQLEFEAKKDVWLAMASRRFSKGVGHFERKVQTVSDAVAHQPLLVSENHSGCPFVRYQGMRSALFGFVTKHACGGRADAQTDRITTLKTALA